MRILFFGSSDFAIPALTALKAAGHAPELVVTKPDAARGRGRKIYDSEVKLAAAELGLPCAQPEDPHAPEFVAQFFKIQANMDPNHRDRVAFLRVCSGRVRARHAPENHQR